jgi:hypothetical protein
VPVQRTSDGYDDRYDVDMNADPYPVSRRLCPTSAGRSRDTLPVTSR